MNPIATIQMKNGAKMVIELLPNIAYNAVCSFIWAAHQGYLDNHDIERIVPGSWIDVSYTAFGKKECQYLLPNKIKEEAKGDVKAPAAGDVAFGYYSEQELCGVEFIFPLRDCPDLLNKCQVFGRVLEGMDEIKRLEAVETYPVPYPPNPAIEINCPVEPQGWSTVTVETYGAVYPEPEKLAQFSFPENWPAL